MMANFPVDAPKRKVIKALDILGLWMLREKEHISLIRESRWDKNTFNNA